MESANVRLAPQFNAMWTALRGTEAAHDPHLHTGLWAQTLIADAIQARASDIHLDPQPGHLRLRFRIDGVVQEVARVSRSHGSHLVRYFKVAANLDPAPSILPEDSHLQFTSDATPLDVRVSCAPCIFGDKLALRLLLRSAIKHRIADLGLHDDDLNSVQRWLDDSSGTFLVAGPVGSGKTTTLYALLGELHLTNRHIVTIEDPVEYELDCINQIEVNPRRGLTFERGLRSALRLDPDYLLFGEIRDPESARIVMDAAGAGRVVMTTIHSRNAVGAVTALRSLTISNFEIAASLAFVVGQRLVRKLCTHCRKWESPTEFERQWLRSLGESVPDRVWHPSECERCSHTGYSGRTGIFEMLPVGAKVYDLILAGEDEHALRKHLRNTGFRPLLRDGLSKVDRGITDYCELTRIGLQSYIDLSGAVPYKSTTNRS